MKIQPFYRVLSGLAALLLGLTVLTACASSDKSDAEETVAPTEPITLPNLTDDRTSTSVDAYADRINTAFAEADPTPATDFTYTVKDGKVSMTAYIGGDTVVVIPETIEGMPVVAIGSEFFPEGATVSELFIPDTVSAIEANALGHCQDLTTLCTPMAAASGKTFFGSLFGSETYETNAAAVPSSLATLILTDGDTIAPYAFYDCDFEAVFLPETITEIGEFAFYGNEKLVYIPLADTALTSVGDRAFANCYELLSLEIPTTVEHMGYAMLEGCAKLETLTIPFTGASREPLPVESETDEGVSPTTDHFAYIFGARAYVHSKGYLPLSIFRVTLQLGCGDIPANAFFECDSIREVIIPSGVTAVGHRAFYGCEKLYAVTLPDSVTALGDDAFHGCIRLVDVDLGEGLNTLGVQTFMNCYSLSSVTLPVGVTYLPDATFSGCVSLETLTAPGVTKVGKQVFRHCDKLAGWASFASAVN